MSDHEATIAELAATLAEIERRLQALPAGPLTTQRVYSHRAPLGLRPTSSYLIGLTAGLLIGAALTMLVMSWLS